MFGFRVRLHNPKSEFPNRTQPKLCGGARGGGGGGGGGGGANREYYEGFENSQ